MPLDIDEILQFLPHRYPFVLVDRVDEVVPGERIVGRKNVSANEPYLQGHFPGNPIVPGVLVVEALAQLCCILAFQTRGRTTTDGFLQYLAGVDDARFKRPVRPGDVLELRGTILGERRQLMRFDCEALVDGELACSVKLMCVERKAERLIDVRAMVDPKAKLGKNVSVGPWSSVGPDVVLGDDCEVGEHVVLRGPTVLGCGNKIYQYSTVGEGSPAFAYKGEPTTLSIGDNNVIREGVTIHRGLATDRSRTVIGNDNLLMAYVHIGHDCVLGNRIVMANNASVAGHVAVGDEAVLERLRGRARSSAASAPTPSSAPCRWSPRTSPPTCAVDGNPAGAVGLNAERLRRLGLDDTVKKALQDAYNTVYRRGLTLKEALEELQEPAATHPEVRCFVDSIERSEHGIIRERRRL